MTDEKKISLTEATREEMKLFAETHLGITFPGNIKDETMRAKIKSAWGNDQIIVMGSDDEPVIIGSHDPIVDVIADLRKAEGDDEEPKEFIVYIETEDKVAGDEPVPLGCNGRVIWVPRGEWCAVPYKFYDSLVHAIELRYPSLPDGGLGPAREVNQFPYRIWNGVGEPKEGVRRPKESTQARNGRAA